MGVQPLLAAAAAELPVESIAGSRVTRPATWVRVLLEALRWMALAAFAALYLRALPRVESWEAAAMSFALIPALTAPTNYYFSFVAAAVLLASRRPRILLAVLGASALWTLNGLAFYLDDAEWIGASVVALALSAGVLWEMANPPSEPNPAEA